MLQNSIYIIHFFNLISRKKLADALQKKRAVVLGGVGCDGRGGSVLRRSAECGFLCLFRLGICAAEAGHFKGRDGCGVFGAEAAPKKSAPRFLGGVGCD